MIAEIISIGTEILRGETTDTNASWLAAQLLLLGIDLQWVTQVGDHQGRLSETFGRALTRSDIIIVTGGLGPTADDLTREAIAETLGEELRVDPDLEAGLRGFFENMGWDMPSHNIKQAMRIPSALGIPNPRGTAPGWWVERDGRVIVAMPGPPREMQPMWQEEVFPALMSRCTGKVIICRTLKIVDMSEAGLDEMVDTVRDTLEVEIGTYAKADGMHLQMVAKDARQEAAREKIRTAEASLRGILEQHIWGVDDDTLVGVVSKILLEKGLNLATMEAYTGGLVAASLGETAESRIYYKGGFVVGSRDAETVRAFLSVSSDGQALAGEDAALAMATAARTRLGARIGIGIAGPEEPRDQGTNVALAIEDGQKTRSRSAQWPSSRFDVRRWIAVSALIELRQFLQD
jgi:nicotinamide-nucleotide amidase